jgi:hypothetical protein
VRSIASYQSFLVALSWLWLAALTVAGLLGADVRRHHFESAGLAFGALLVAYAAVALQGAPEADAAPSQPSAVTTHHVGAGTRGHRGVRVDAFVAQLRREER